MIYVHTNTWPMDTFSDANYNKSGVNSSCTVCVHLSVIIQIVLAAAGATSTMAHRVRVSVRVSVSVR